jgi:hypothetical protein
VLRPKPDPLGGVRLEQGAALVAIAWLIGAVLVLGRSIRHGRSLADEFAKRHPEAYEAQGRSRPGYLYSVRRDRFAQFVARRDYENLGDPALALEFEAYRKTEARLVVSILVSMLVVLVLVLAARHAT